jgi:hypothetical protein
VQLLLLLAVLLHQHVLLFQPAQWATLVVLTTEQVVGTVSLVLDVDVTSVAMLVQLLLHADQSLVAVAIAVAHQ